MRWKVNRMNKVNKECNDILFVFIRLIHLIRALRLAHIISLLLLQTSDRKLLDLVRICVRIDRKYEPEILLKLPRPAHQINKMQPNYVLLKMRKINMIRRE